MNLDTTSPETSVGVVEVTKSQDLKKTDFAVNITGTEDITVELDQTELTATFTLGEDVQTGTYIATFTCGEAQPQNVTLNVTAPRISLDKSTLTLDDGDVSTSTGVIHVTRSSDIAEAEISVAMSGESNVTVTPNNTTGDVTFALNDNSVAGEYTATFTCGDAEPVTADITVVITPAVTTNKSTLALNIQSSGSQNVGTVTAYKPEQYAQTDLTVEVTGTEAITTSINQSTGVITFTAAKEATIAGDYVATISCGDAKPANVTITVTAPAVEELFVNLNNNTCNLDSTTHSKTFQVIRKPNYSQGEITYEFDGDSDLYEVSINQYASYMSPQPSKWRADVTVHKTAQGTTPNTMTLHCGSVSATVTVNYL